MFFDSSGDGPRTSWKTPVKPHARDGLTTGSTGIMPNEYHSGLADIKPQPSLQRRYSMRAGLSSAPRHAQGRRHLDPHHFTSLTDDAKRAEGRLGRAHVASSEQQKRADAYYATKQPTVAQPPGAECNLYLTSYYYTPLSKRDSPSPPIRQPTGFRADAQNTSFQLSEARLRKIKREHPLYEEEVERALQQHHGDYSIVSTEQKISRRVAVEEYAKDSDARVAHIEASTKYHGTPDLGSPASAIERSVPYALTEACPPRADTQLSCTSHVRMYPGRGRSSSPQVTPVKPCDRHLHDGPAPYDSVAVSGSAYPSPPVVGERCNIYAKPTLVRVDERRHLNCMEDTDSLAMKRARARSGASVSKERPDFIFGPGPPPQVHQPSLRHRTEARWKAQEHSAQERRTGRALCPQSYKSTSLW
ncbi:hypothetical protein JIQ42_01374 [Leishmania sp. Namibia]|uniref:hypothetical protein n=1 Tax=Leishmania sp. Namibia TaxID=2802991 RepID=UPI001B5965CE|nr:hypothetical protein JIQ42_01374 [Leishmania sp. Namibia]